MSATNEQTASGRSDVGIFRPTGAGAGERYVVVKVYRGRFLLCRSPSLDLAGVIANEWRSNCFLVEPGEERPLRCEPHPHPPLVAYSGPEHLKRTAS